MLRQQEDFRIAEQRQVQQDMPRRATAVAEGGDTDTLEGQNSAYHLARVNHSGTQAISTVSGLQAALDGRLVIVAAPATASSTGVAGTVAYDSDFFYVCIATDTWKRGALTTW